MLCWNFSQMYFRFVLLSSQQIQKVILALGDYMQASCHACIGGTNMRNEIAKFQAEAPHIVVGTPGRVYDMINRGHLCRYHHSRSKLAGLLIWKAKHCSFHSPKVYQDVCVG